MGHRHHAAMHLVWASILLASLPLVSSDSDDLAEANIGRREAYYAELINSPEDDVLGRLDAPIAFKHMSKAGGRFLTSTLQDIFGSDILIVADSAESGWLLNKTADRKQFLLGSVREPCDWYVSMWGYLRDSLTKETCYKKGTCHKEAHKDHPLLSPYIQKGQKLNASDPSPAGFQAFLASTIGRFTMNVGLVTHLFLENYGGIGGLVIRKKRKQQVPVDATWFEATPLSELAHAPDCFIDQNGLSQNLRSCLKQYEAAGGKVSWKKVKKAMKKNEAKLKKTTKSKQGTDKGEQWKSTDRGSCSSYYNDDAKNLVESKDSILMKKFGYSCCAGASIKTEL